MNTSARIGPLLLLFYSLLLAPFAFPQGTLAPAAGPPAPTMRTLQQIEPRIPISSLPFTISEPGSYYLTGDLEFTASSGDAITIGCSNVSLDLMGFTLSSTDNVNGSAIFIFDGHREVEVRNGTIKGGTEVNVSGTAPNQTWTVTPAGFRYGIHASSPSSPPQPSSCHFRNLRISRCRTDGLKGGDQAVVEQVTAAKNGSQGISLASDGTVSHSTASWNGGTGILAPGGSVTNCSAGSNNGNGISAGSVTNSTGERNRLNGIGGSSVSNCSANLNGDNGISSSGTVTNCAATSNGDHGISGANVAVANSKASDNGDHGINVLSGSVINCAAHSNGGNGINASGVIAFCVASSNIGLHISASASTTRTGNYPTP